MPKQLVFDRWLFLTAGALLVAGLFLVGSASHYEAMRYGRDASHFLVRHVIFAAAGLAAMLVAIRIPKRWLDDTRVVGATIAVTFLSLLAVLAMPAAAGARRWFSLGPVKLQPSEFAKIAAVLFVAWLLARREERVNEPRAVLVPCLAVAAMALLVVIQPDLGSAVMIVAPAAAMLFVAGLRWKSLALGAVGGAAAFAVAVIAEPYRMRRIFSFLHPEEDLQGAGFQLYQSLLAFGSGGWGGVGFGQGQQKAYFLPAPHTDFLFSVVGEEMGLAGTLALLAAVMVLFWRGMRASMRTPDRFLSYLALGLTVLVVLQALVHMAVCVGLVPTKGLPLPFLSYGGSSLVATLFATGLLVNVSQHAK